MTDLVQRLQAFAEGDSRGVTDPRALDLAQTLLDDAYATREGALEAKHTAAWLLWYRFHALAPGGGNAARKDAEALFAQIAAVDHTMVPEPVAHQLAAANPSLPSPEETAACRAENLGRSWSFVFNRSRRVRHLDNVIRAHATAVDGTPSGSLELGRRLTNLCRALLIQARHTRGGDIDHVLKTYARTFPRLAEHDPTRRRVLADFSIAWQERHMGSIRSGGPTASSAPAKQAGRDAVSTSRTAHSTTLWTLFAALLNEYEHTGDPEDLDEAISRGAQAAQLASPGDPQHAAGKANLAASHLRRFMSTTDPADLDSAWVHGRDAVGLTAAGDPRTVQHLDILGNVLQVRYYTREHAADLDAAIDIWRQAVRAAQDDSQARNYFQTRLATALLTRIENTGQNNELDEAIELARRSVDEATAGEPELLQRRANLANALMRRFALTGDRADLAAVANVGRIATSAMADPAVHESLAATLSALYEQTDDLADLDAAISHAAAAARTREGSPATGAYAQHHLCRLLTTRYERAGRAADLDAAVDAGRRAVRDSNNMPAAEKSELMHLAACCLFNRYQRNGGSKDLQDAIGLFRQAADTASSTDPNRPTFLNDLAVAMGRRAGEHLDELASLDAAVAAARTTAQSGDITSEFQIHRLTTLADALINRFRRTGDPDDINTAVDVYRRAIANHPNSGPQLFTNLGIALRLRYGRTHEVADLDAAVGASQKAAILDPDNPELPGILTNLGNALTARFDATGAAGDLDNAIAHLQRAADLTVSHDPKKALRLTNLAAAYQRRFGETGHLGDIEQAVDAATRAVHSYHPNQQTRANSHTAAANALIARYERLGETKDLDAATTHCRAAAEHTSAEHPERARCLANLAAVLRHRYSRHGVSADLDEAIATAHEAVRSTHLYDPEYGIRLSNLTVALRARHALTGSPTDLQDAIDIARRAAALAAPGEPRAVRQTIQLSQGLIDRFDQSGDPADLAEAIAGYRQAVNALPSHHPDRATCGYNLADALIRRFDQAGDAGDLTTAITLWKRSAAQTNAPSQVRVLAAGRAAHLSAQLYKPAGAAAAYHDAVSLLPLLAWRGIQRQDQERLILSSAGSTARDAAAAATAALADGIHLVLSETGPLAISAGLPVQVVESGRCLIWSAKLDIRSDLSDLEQQYPDLAARLRSCRARLEAEGEAGQP
ncbi:hypothetical protein [Catellatospora sp. IY07-71]|uniref:hypothetical protein n=1 Tax=Catellatospora sp. IY07-71 TaxID=2728827 RepID=UPI001BB36682|nr:hypothetical protein [Catellatospora sp. IY07-71]